MSDTKQNQCDLNLRGKLLFTGTRRECQCKIYDYEGYIWSNRHDHYAITKHEDQPQGGAKQ